MLVKDLIERLGKYDPESIIYVDHGGPESSFGLCSIREFLTETCGDEKEADEEILEYEYNPASPVITGRN